MSLSSSIVCQNPIHRCQQPCPHSTPPPADTETASFMAPRVIVVGGGCKHAPGLMEDRSARLTRYQCPGSVLRTPSIWLEATFSYSTRIVRACVQGRFVMVSVADGSLRLQTSSVATPPRQRPESTLLLQGRRSIRRLPTVYSNSTMILSSLPETKPVQTLSRF